MALDFDLSIIEEKDDIKFLNGNPIKNKRRWDGLKNFLEKAKIPFNTIYKSEQALFIDLLESKNLRYNFNFETRTYLIGV